MALAAGMWFLGGALGADANYVVVYTGQTEFYGDWGTIRRPIPGTAFFGQDAHHAGVQPAYQDNGDGTVTDLNTGLAWQKAPDFERMMTWNDAMGYADSLQLGGHGDWRLPSIKELYSIISHHGSIRTMTPYINTNYFDFQYPDTSVGWRIIDAQYWSSTLYVGTIMWGNQGAFGVNFADGRIKCYPLSNANGPTMRSFVRCVRGPQYGVNKFMDNGDGTVTDKATGLMWSKRDSRRPMNWRQALAHSERLKLAGHDDWRLPNAKELQSIVDYTRAPDALDSSRRGPAIDPVFKVTRTESWHWTGATHGDRVSDAIYLCFGRGLSVWRWHGGQVNAHGAGAQRSDPKAGNPALWRFGNGPQGDEVRIYNYVRVVRTAPPDTTAETAADETPRVSLEVSVRGIDQAEVEVSPDDVDGLAGDSAPYRRTYPAGAIVELTAASEAAGLSFARWERRDRSLISKSTAVALRLAADTAVVAVYERPRPRRVRPGRAAPRRHR